MPKDHLLRRINAVIYFSFIHDRVAALYCSDNGRPALDPTLMFKALFTSYLFGVRSQRRLPQPNAAQNIKKIANAMAQKPQQQAV